MSCSVATMASSPVFSPSRASSSIFCKSSSSETLASGSGSSSPFRYWIQNPRSSSSHEKLKRKRPGRLDIPVASMDFADVPAIIPSDDDLEEEMNGYGVCCKRGRRATAMEDRYSALVVDSKQAFFGVFDGHGGAKAAEFAAETLGKNILDEFERRGEDDFENGVKHGYLKTDSDFLKEDSHGGSCCVTALISKGNLVVSNAGDCRAVMSRAGIAEAVTSDHRPSREDEKDRIEALGGYVDNCHDVWRIQGSLAVSRGIGDRQLKQWVIAEPETKVIRISPATEFLILASDGLWDKISNKEAIDDVRPLCVGVDKPQPLSACKKLVDLAISRGSTDDTSVMIILLGSYL